MLDNLVKKTSKCHIQFMSDLHLERIDYQFQIERYAPTLILGGDIGRFCDLEKYRDFLRKQCEQFDQVLLVAGNHEFYGSTREGGFAAVHELTNDPCLNNLTFMHRTKVSIPNNDVIVLGCTLQSHIGPDCGRFTNDFKRIKEWSIEKHNAEHDLDSQWLERSLREIADEDPSQRVIVATHYAPAFEKTCHPDNERNAASQCFSSDTLEASRNWIGAKQVTHWIFGHTHWNTSFKFRNTVVISNQLCNDSKNLNWLQKHTIYRAFDPKAAIQT